MPAPRGRYAHPQAPPEQSQYLVVEATSAPGLIGGDVIGDILGCEVVGGDTTGIFVGCGALSQIISA